MNFVGEEVIHSAFGKGSVIDYDESYINIKFESGEKRFVFPDVFKEYVEFTNQKAKDVISEKLQKRAEKREEEEERLRQERAVEEERLQLLEQRQRRKNKKIHPKIQSVFWCKKEEEEKCFDEWRVFTGTIKSGQRKGEPRRLARMNQNSACLLTKRSSDAEEGDRQILGLFMASESFDGRECEDGYIVAHPDHRIQFTKEESEKMLFWNYYVDKKFPTQMVWNSGRQRYFDNIWMAQILRDVIALREDPKEKEAAQAFFDYFCQINLIDKDELPAPNGALKRIEQK